MKIQSLVMNYLRCHYLVSEQDVINLALKYSDLIKDAQEIGSFAYYPGDIIAEQEKLIHKNPCEECNK